MNDKQKALEQAILQIEKQFGKGAIMKLGEQKDIEVEIKLEKSSIAKSANTSPT